MTNQQAFSPGGKTEKTISSTIFLLIFVSVLITINALLLSSVQGKKKALHLLKNNKNMALAALDDAKKDQHTGMLAASILKEQEGWNNATPVAALLLDYFARIPLELRVSSIFLDRQPLLRSLPEEKKTAYFHYTLALGGISSIELEDAGTGQAKYIIPRFLEDTRSSFEADFSVNRAETETGTAVNSWLFSTEWPLQLLWKETSAQQEGNFDG